MVERSSDDLFILFIKSNKSDRIELPLGDHNYGPFCGFCYGFQDLRQMENIQSIRLMQIENEYDAANRPHLITPRLFGSCRGAIKGFQNRYLQIHYMVGIYICMA